MCKGLCLHYCCKPRKAMTQDHNDATYTVLLQSASILLNGNYLSVAKPIASRSCATDVVRPSLASLSHSMFGLMSDAHKVTRIIRTTSQHLCHLQNTSIAAGRVWCCAGIFDSAVGCEELRSPLAASFVS
ncbi:unnamed protein product [Effrenium voratum]|uniref:Uncharacterized protein n=1 Tax=Effrenium voratum TaxID=2562239 RepID=A0AA36MP69_9DINO|nr:unnamed protein product [Effrenium voratum]